MYFYSGECNFSGETRGHLFVPDTVCHCVEFQLLFNLHTHTCVRRKVQPSVIDLFMGLLLKVKQVECCSQSDYMYIYMISNGRKTTKIYTKK